MTNKERESALRRMLKANTRLSSQVVSVQNEAIRILHKALFYQGAWVNPYPQSVPEHWINALGKYSRWVHRKGDPEKDEERGLNIYENQIKYQWKGARWEKTGTWIGFGDTIYADLKIEEAEVALIGEPKAEFDQYDEIYNNLDDPLTKELTRTVEMTESHTATRADEFTQRILASVEGGWAADQGWNFNAKAEAEVGFKQVRGSEDGTERKEILSNTFGVTVQPGGYARVTTTVDKQGLRRTTLVKCRVDFAKVVLYVKHNASMAASGWKWRGRAGTGLRAYHNVGECAHRNTDNNKVNRTDLKCKIESDSLAGIVDELLGAGKHRWREDPIPKLAPFLTRELQEIHGGRFGRVEGRRVRDSKIASRIVFRADGEKTVKKAKKKKTA